MNNNTSDIQQLVVLPSGALEKLQSTQEQILKRLNDLQIKPSGEEYLTASEFMERTKISRATFDEKRANNEIKVIKKGRKLYLEPDAVRKYFEG